MAYTRHYAPRVATTSQVSREGIRPISINGQEDTCCLIVTDGYARLTTFGCPLFLAACLTYLSKKMKEK